tara:strand:+ start:123 stop:479 length:357 start_codon:yes stop_codon:yes gene_type:complete
MKFRLNRKSYAPNKGKKARNLLNYESIVEYIRCDTCSSRDKSNLDVGFSQTGLQVFCCNCYKNIIHIKLPEGAELEADIHPQGTFNKQKLELRDFKLVNFSSKEILKKKKEEEDIANV